MKTIHNPYEILMQQMSELKKIVIDIRDQPKEDYTTKYYTRKEAAKITRRSVQTIDNYIDRGLLHAESFGDRGILIHHYQLFDKNNSLRDLKRRKKA